MTIESYKTKDGQRYRAVFEFQGQRHKQRGFQTQREADAWIVDERRRLNSETERSLCCHISDFSKKYFEAEASRLSRTTLNYKRRYVQEFFEFLGKDTPVESITREVAMSFQKHLLQKLGPPAANRRIREIKALWNWHMTNTGLVSSNPFKIPKIPEVKYIPYIPPKEDIDKVLAVADGWEKDYLLIMLSTAARRGEIRKLTWDDIDFEQKLIRLKTKKRQGGGEEWDNLPMNPIAESVLKKRYLDKKRHPVAVFPAKVSLRAKTVFVGERSPHGMLEQLCAKAGVKPFSFHPLRHYVASILRDKHQASLFEIQHVLRHKNPGTTAIYLETLKTPVQKPLDSLAGDFSSFV